MATVKLFVYLVVDYLFGYSKVISKILKKNVVKNKAIDVGTHQLAVNVEM